MTHAPQSALRQSRNGSQRFDRIIRRLALLSAPVILLQTGGCMVDTLGVFSGLVTSIASSLIGGVVAGQLGLM